MDEIASNSEVEVVFKRDVVDTYLQHKYISKPMCIYYWP